MRCSAKQRTLSLRNLRKLDCALRSGAPLIRDRSTVCVTVPGLQRITPQVLRAALRPGHTFMQRVDAGALRGAKQSVGRNSVAFAPLPDQFGGIRFAIPPYATPSRMRAILMQAPATMPTLLAGVRARAGAPSAGAECVAATRSSSPA